HDYVGIASAIPQITDDLLHSRSRRSRASICKLTWNAHGRISDYFTLGARAPPVPLSVRFFLFGRPAPARSPLGGQAPAQPEGDNQGRPCHPGCVPSSLP